MKEAARQRTKYIVSDLVASLVGFLAFTIIRYDIIKYYLPQKCASLHSFLLSPAVVAEIALIPLLLVFISWLTGFYSSAFYKSRLQVIGNSILVSFIIMMIVFLVVLLNDVLPRRLLNYELMAMLFGLLSVLLMICRLTIANIDTRAINRGERDIYTLMVGASSEAENLKRRVEKAHNSMGLNIIGCVDLKDGPIVKGNNLPIIEFDDIADFCKKNNVRAFILCPYSKNNERLMEIANSLLPMNIPIYISPDLHNPIMARPTFSNVAGEPLIDISRPKSRPGMQNVKRLFDIVVSVLALIVLSPLFAIIAVAIKLDSKGPVFYRQPRLGFHRKEFDIVKFRSMRTDAERNGEHLLSAPDDNRVTKVGRFIRKYRIDELPNFWNVLCGDMSIVGPRPEREFFAKQILERSPIYALIYAVRPGITSWGMVKFGYAQNVDEMLERMRYDLLYLDNVSITTDIKIMFYTVKTVITGQGV